jgi:hypothetical protein
MIQSSTTNPSCRVPCLSYDDTSQKLSVVSPWCCRSAFCVTATSYEGPSVIPSLQCGSGSREDTQRLAFYLWLVARDMRLVQFRSRITSRYACDVLYVSKRAEHTYLGRIHWIIKHLDTLKLYVGITMKGIANVFMTSSLRS